MYIHTIGFYELTFRLSKKIIKSRTSGFALLTLLLMYNDKPQTYFTFKINRTTLACA